MSKFRGLQRNSLHHRTRKYFRGAGSSGGGTGNCGLRKPKSASHEVFGTHSDILQGEQPVIVDCRLFDAVQAKLDRQVNSFKVTRQMSGALLAGRLYDNRGNRMSPSHTVKRGIKYRYYLSSALLQGQAKRAGSVPRAPAAEIETVVLKAVREHLKLADRIDDRNLVNTRIVRVIVEPERLVIILAPHQKSGRRQTKSRNVLHILWHKTPSKRQREILQPSTSETQCARAIRSETRATLIASIVRGRRWLDELVTDSNATSERIAAREKCSVRKVNMTISLAFLAPCVYRKVYPLMIWDLTGKIPCSSPEFPVPVK